MPRPIKIKGPVGPEEKQKPALRIQFAGADQTYFFSLRKIARETLGIDATRFGRQLIIEAVKMYRENPKSGPIAKAIQTTMKLEKEGAQ